MTVWQIITCVRPYLNWAQSTTCMIFYVSGLCIASAVQTLRTGNACFFCFQAVVFAQTFQTLTVALHKEVRLTVSLSVPTTAMFSWINEKNVTIAQGLSQPLLTIANMSARDEGAYTVLAEFRPLSGMPTIWSSTATISIIVGKLVFVGLWYSALFWTALYHMYAATTCLRNHPFLHPI